MPKNTGLGLAMKTMVWGKEIITMLNYWECEQIDTQWTEMSLNQFKGLGQWILSSNSSFDFL